MELGVLSAYRMKRLQFSYCHRESCRHWSDPALTNTWEMVRQFDKMPLPEVFTIYITNGAHFFVHKSTTCKNHR